MEERGLFISLHRPLGRPWWGLGRRAQRWVSVWGWGAQIPHCQHFDNYLLSAALCLSFLLKNHAGAVKPPRNAGERVGDSNGDNPNFKWSLVPSPPRPSATDNSPSSQLRQRFRSWLAWWFSRGRWRPELRCSFYFQTSCPNIRPCPCSTWRQLRVGGNLNV